MVAGQHLEAVRFRGVGAGDEILDQPELLQRPADLLKPARRNAIRVPLRLKEALDIDLRNVHVGGAYRPFCRADDTFSVTLSARDLVGNSASIAAGTFRTLLSVPAAPDVDTSGAIVLSRAPYGTS